MVVSPFLRRPRDTNLNRKLSQSGCKDDEYISKNESQICRSDVRHIPVQLDHHVFEVKTFGSSAGTCERTCLTISTEKRVEFHKMYAQLLTSEKELPRLCDNCKGRILRVSHKNVASHSSAMARCSLVDVVGNSKHVETHTPPSTISSRFSSQIIRNVPIYSDSENSQPDRTNAQEKGTLESHPSPCFSSQFNQTVKAGMGCRLVKCVTARAKHLPKVDRTWAISFRQFYFKTFPKATPRTYGSLEMPQLNSGPRFLRRSRYLDRLFKRYGPDIKSLDLLLSEHDAVPTKLNIKGEGGNKSKGAESEAIWSCHTDGGLTSSPEVRESCECKNTKFTEPAFFPRNSVKVPEREFKPNAKLLKRYKNVVAVWTHRTGWVSRFLLQALNIVRAPFTWIWKRSKRKGNSADHSTAGAHLAPCETSSIQADSELLPYSEKSYIYADSEHLAVSDMSKVNSDSERLWTRHPSITDFKPVPLSDSPTFHTESEHLPSREVFSAQKYSEHLPFREEFSVHTDSEHLPFREKYPVHTDSQRLTPSVLSTFKTDSEPLSLREDSSTYTPSQRLSVSDASPRHIDPCGLPGHLDAHCHPQLQHNSDDVILCNHCRAVASSRFANNDRNRNASINLETGTDITGTSASTESEVDAPHPEISHGAPANEPVAVTFIGVESTIPTEGTDTPRESTVRVE